MDQDQLSHVANSGTPTGAERAATQSLAGGAPDGVASQSDIRNPQSAIPPWLPWSVLAAVTLIFGSVTVVYPFGRDQLYYSFIGDCLLHGKILYRDIPMMQMPLTGVVHALALILFGRTMTAIRVLDLFWTFATAGLIFLFVRRAFGRPWLALAAVIMYPAFYFTYDYWQSAQVDGFLNLPLAAAFYLTLRALTGPGSEAQPPISTASRARVTSSPALQLLFAGLLLGLTFLFKYTILLVLPFMALVVLLARGAPTKAAWRDALLLIAGCVGVFLLFLLALALTGGLSSFAATTVGLAIPYSRTGQSGLDLLPKLLRMFQSYFRPAEYQIGGWLGLLGATVGLGLLVQHVRPPARERIALVMIFVWLLAALSSVYIQGKMFYYHYLSILPPLAILAGLALVLVLRPLSERITGHGFRIGLLAFGVFIFIVGTPYADRLQDLSQIVLGRVQLRDFWHERFAHSDYSVGEMMDLAEYIRDNTSAQTRVANFGLDPGICFPYWREPVVKFTTTYGLDAKDGQLPPEFAANPPEVLVVTHEDRAIHVRGHNRDSYEMLLDFTGLRNLVLDQYEVETHIGRFDVMRRFNSDRELPAAVRGGPALDADLKEALQFISENRAGRARTIIWPVAVLRPELVETRFRTLLPAMISQRTLNHSLWLREKTLADFLPAVSVWINDDDRPLAGQPPFSFQNEGTNFLSDGFRFTNLDRGRDGLVSVYLIEPQTGEEAVAPNVEQ